MAFLTCAEAETVTGYSAAYLKDLCRLGQVPKAEKKGKTWLAPESSWQKIARDKRRPPGRPRKVGAA